MDLNLQEGYEACRKIMKASGKSYYFATSLFGDVWMKRFTWALYAFFRIPDDIVDEQLDKAPEVLDVELSDFAQSWRTALAAGTSNNAKMAAIVDTFKRCAIPAEYGESFLRSMALDIRKKQYATYTDLEEYMYGSAGTVGIMMAMVIGYEDPQAPEYAKTLGYAMQLTNFLRDIDKDYQELGRIYMPQDELARFNLSHADIANRMWSEDFKAFMEFQVSRAWSLYEDGNKCLPLLNPKGRFAYKMASVLYSRILTKLAQQDFNPFVGRASTSFGEKLWLLLKTKVVG